MSIEDQKEHAAYVALEAISSIPRPNERARICRIIIQAAALIGGYDVHFTGADDKKGS